MPTTESDRDDLARIIFTATHEFRHQTWEQTSEGWRNRCRAKADEAMAAGWRKVGAEQIDDLAHHLRDATFDIAGSESPWEVPSGALYAIGDEIEHRLRAALADPAGANGGE